MHRRWATKDALNETLSGTLSSEWPFSRSGNQELSGVGSGMVGKIEPVRSTLRGSRLRRPLPQARTYILPQVAS